MNKRTNPLPAKFKYVAFLDLLVDAAYQHRLATQTSDSFEMSRHARASVAAAFLTIECIANCLLSTMDIPKALCEELDKLQPLAKIEIALRSVSKTSYDRGRHEVQKAVEVIKVRNEYVHSKAVQVAAQVHLPQDAGANWLLPLAIEASHWKSLGIPKQSMFWSKDVSRGVLQVVRDFLKYVLVDVMDADENTLKELLLSQFTFGSIVVPAVFEVFKKEVAWLTDQKIDFSFLLVLNE